jgi:hypothetical protein
MIYLTAIGLTPGGSGTVHIYTQYTEYRDGTYITIKKLTNLGSVYLQPQVSAINPAILRAITLKIAELMAETCWCSYYK